MVVRIVGSNKREALTYVLSTGAYVMERFKNEALHQRNTLRESAAFK